MLILKALQAVIQNEPQRLQAMALQFFLDKTTASRVE
jgi:hypothetical protein